MPRYTYQCSNCEAVFEAVHSMKELLTDCEHCGQQEVLIRVPAMTFINTGTSTGESGRKVGELVEQHIEEARKELKEDKNKLQIEEYKENK